MEANGSLSQAWQARREHRDGGGICFGFQYARGLV